MGQAGAPVAPLRRGRFGTLLLPVAVATLVVLARTLLRGQSMTLVLVGGITAVVASLYFRRRFRLQRTMQQYEIHAAYGARRTTVGEAGLTTTGENGEENSFEWASYPWWFETPELFGLTGSYGFLFVLPKSAAASPEDLARARALFQEHLRRI